MSPASDEELLARQSALQEEVREVLAGLDLAAPARESLVPATSGHWPQGLHAAARPHQAHGRPIGRARCGRSILAVLCTGHSDNNEGAGPAGGGLRCLCRSQRMVVHAAAGYLAPLAGCRLAACLHGLCLGVIDREGPTVIILDSNRGALMVWLKPMREGLPGDCPRR